MRILREQVAVIGGGISGLVSAYRLLQKGIGVTLFESSDQLGGLGGTFEHEGHTFEAFHHAMNSTDEHLLSLLSELGLDNEASWTEAKTGFLCGRQLYPFQSPMDLLLFGGLSLPARLRTAAGAAYITRMCNDPHELDGISVTDWLLSLFGEEVFLNLWRPLLRARFGDLYETVPAYWLWSRIRRETSGGREKKGHLPGGYGRIADRLRDEIVRIGGRIRLRTPITAVQPSPWDVQLQADGKYEPFDAAIATIPMPQLHKIARGKLPAMLPRRDLAYQGVVNAVAILKNRLQPFYRTVVAKYGYPFQSVVETTNLAPGDRHVVYLQNCCPHDSETYNRSDADIKFQALKSMRDFNPKFRVEWVEDIQVFRAAYVEPVWTLDYNRTKPRMRVGDSRLYLATTAQCYPQENTWNTMTGIANDIAGRVLFDIENIHRTQKRPEESAAVA